MTEPAVTWELRARILRTLDGVVGVTVDVLRPNGIRTTGAGGAAEVQVAAGRVDVLAHEVASVAAGMMRDLDPAARDQFARLVQALARGVERAETSRKAPETSGTCRRPAGSLSTRERMARALDAEAFDIAPGHENCPDCLGRIADAFRKVDAVLDVLADDQTETELHVPTNAAASRLLINRGGAAWAAGVEAIRVGATAGVLT